MSAKSILVAYASRYGSTQEVAESVAACLRAAGNEVDLQPMGEVKTLDPYDAVVIGAAIYNTKWHPDAHHFLSQYEGAIRQRPLAIFALGPLSTSGAAMRKSRGELDRELRQYRWLKPVALEMFPGKLDASKLGFLARMVTKTSDYRDWEGIRAWANQLARRLQQEQALQPA